MIPAKPINAAQLHAEALAVPASTHVALTLLGGTISDGIVTGASDLLCSDVAGSSETHEPCTACLSAYNAHVAAPTVLADPLAAKREALETAVTADVQAGKMSAAVAVALGDLLTAMAPHG